MEKNSIEYLIGEHLSPDLNVMETWVKVIREKFTQRSCTTPEQGIQRFFEIY